MIVVASATGFILIIVFLCWLHLRNRQKKVNWIIRIQDNAIFDKLQQPVSKTNGTSRFFSFKDMNFVKNICIWYYVKAE